MTAITPDMIDAWVISEALSENIRECAALAAVMMKWCLEFGQTGVYFIDGWHCEIGVLTSCVLWEKLHRFYDEEWTIAYAQGSMTRFFCSGKPPQALLHEWARRGLILTGTNVYLAGYRTD